MENERYLNEYERIKKRSMSGDFVDRQQARKERRQIRMQKEEKLRRIRRVVVAASFALMVAASPVLIHNFVDNRIMDSLVMDFKTEVIAPETHRTDDNQHYFYDEADIADKITSMDDIDEAVYLLQVNVGEHNTNQILEHTDYGSFDGFKEERGYESTEDFMRRTREHILDKTKNEENHELSNMMQESDKDDSIENDFQRMGEK